MANEDYEYVDSDHRIGAEYDDYPENPRDSWDGHLTAFIDCDDLYREYVGNGSQYVSPTELHDDPTGNLREAFSRMYGLGSNMSVSHYVSRAATIERWARIFHGVAVQWDEKYHGFWAFSPEAWAGVGNDTPLTDIRAQDNEIDSERFVYEQWATGSVQFIFAQTRTVSHTVKTAADGTVLSDEETEEWVTTDSIGSIYPDRGQEYGEAFRRLMRETANDYFDEEYHSDPATV